MQERLKALALTLLQDGTCHRILGWKRGEFFYDLIPAVFTTAEEVERDFCYSPFASTNLSKYLIAESRKEGKIAAFLKPCDTYSCQQLLKEHRICREHVYIIAIACDGMLSIDALREAGVTAPTALREDADSLKIESLYGDVTLPRKEALYPHCRDCKSKTPVLFDRRIGEDAPADETARFAQVEALETMTPEERFAFWQGELSRCIRCNACRNICPACSCEKCVFDNPDSGIQNKAAANGFEENLFHIIRAFHVAGRCTDCGQCSMVCPQHIPLHLLNRKFIKDINALYGPYQAGADPDTVPPLTRFDVLDPEPSVVKERGGNA